MIKTTFKKLVTGKLFGIKIYNSFYIKKVKKWRVSGLSSLCGFIERQIDKGYKTLQRKEKGKTKGREDKGNG